jgi:hypothetical protein
MNQKYPAGGREEVGPFGPSLYPLAAGHGPVVYWAPTSSRVLSLRQRHRPPGTACPRFVVPDLVT